MAILMSKSSTWIHCGEEGIYIYFSFARFDHINDLFLELKPTYLQNCKTNKMSSNGNF